MAEEKKKEGSGCAFVLAVILIVGTTVWLMISNIFSLGIVWHFGPGQYLANIIHFHNDFYMTTRKEMNVYEKIFPIGDISSGRVKPLIQFPEDKSFELKGYKSAGHVTWLAVKTQKDGELVYAYGLVPKDISGTIKTILRSVPFFSNEDEKIQNEYFQETSPQKLDEVGQKLFDEFIDLTFSRFKIEKATGNMKIQEIKESSNNKLINLTYKGVGLTYYHGAGEDSSFYCSAQEYEKLRELKDDMLGENNFDKNLFK